MSPIAGGGWTETVLHSFGNGTDGYGPNAGVILDAAGNLYGTTEGGGTHSQGTVFKLSPSEGGGWTETVLHNFGNGTEAGAAYPAAGLIFDAAGNLYGTSVLGGTYYSSSTEGGTVFELTPTVGGVWKETVLHSFGSGTDGNAPVAGVILDAAGNLYGTTEFGGTNLCGIPQNYGCGTVFKLTPNAVGGWTETVLHNFGNGTDGWDVIVGLIMDAAGNLYGTTVEGGIPTSNGGIVFELTPAADGSWTETVLHSFGGVPDGEHPFSLVIFDAAGNLYGTTGYGGIYDWGTGFELTPNAGGGWTETVLYSFCSQNDCTDGSIPLGSLVLDAAGNLYGTTGYGGTPRQCDGPVLGCGTVFELRPAPCTECSNAF